MPWDAETAREAGRKGGIAKAKKQKELAAMNPQERAVLRIVENLEPLTDKLVDAALKRGDFEGVNSELQMKALLASLAYGIGRPATRKLPEPDKPPEKEPEEGIVFASAEDADTEAETGDF